MDQKIIVKAQLRLSLAEEPERAGVVAYEMCNGENAADYSSLAEFYDTAVTVFVMYLNSSLLRITAAMDINSEDYCEKAAKEAEIFKKDAFSIIERISDEDNTQLEDFGEYCLYLQTLTDYILESFIHWEHFSETMFGSHCLAYDHDRNWCIYDKMLNLTDASDKTDLYRFTEKYNIQIPFMYVFCYEMSSALDSCSHFNSTHSFADHSETEKRPFLNNRPFQHEPSAAKISHNGLNMLHKKMCSHIDRISSSPVMRLMFWYLYLSCAIVRCDTDADKVDKAEIEFYESVELEAKDETDIEYVYYEKKKRSIECSLDEYESKILLMRCKCDCIKSFRFEDYIFLPHILPMATKDVNLYYDARRIWRTWDSYKQSYPGHDLNEVRKDYEKLLSSKNRLFSSPPMSPVRITLDQLSHMNLIFAMIEREHELEQKNDEVAQKNTELQLALDENKSIIRAFSHHSANVSEHYNLYEISESLKKLDIPEDIKLPLCRKLLYEFSERLGLKKSIELLKLQFVDTDELREKLHGSLSSRDKAPGLKQLLDLSAKETALSLFFSKESRKESFREAIKDRYSWENLEDDVSRMAFTDDVSAYDWLSSKIFRAEPYCCSQNWSNLRVRVENYAYYFISGIFTEVLNNIVHYADISKPITISFDEDEKFLLLITENSKSKENLFEQNGEGLEAEKVLLNRVNGCDDSLIITQDGECFCLKMKFSKSIFIMEA